MLIRLFLATSFALAPGVWLAAEEAIDFNRDIRPVLSNHCFACHGPDAEHREAGLRLDDADAALLELDSGDRAIVPGDVDAGTLVARITSSDEADRMPPAEFNKPLTRKQTDLLTRWIAEGAQFQKHWSLVPPQTPAELPNVRDQSKVDGSIDRFIVARAEAAGLEINDIADRATLARRASLDLTGLPPTSQEAREFAGDDSPDAYERLLDRLLETKRYGEHQARYWLDLVRYGDTHGLHLDNYREMWPYRDWVINALNNNMPFDQFITEQLAGDLLENATLEQQIASGFNRLNVTTSEGGSIYEEVYVRNCVDRVTAFGTIFLGMTTGCAVCHDHKFDPLTMRDFYSLFAYFNSLDGRALDANKKDHPPTVRVLTPEIQQQLAELDDELREIEAEMNGPLPSVTASQRRWEARLAGDTQEVRWQVLQPESFTSESDLQLKVLEDSSILAEGVAAARDTLTIQAKLPAGRDWQLLRLEALPAEGNNRVGLSGNGNAVLSEIEVETKSAATGNRWLPIKFVYGEADYEQAGGKFALGYAFDGKVKPDEGWAVGGHEELGGRSAWFVASSMLGEGEDARLRVRLKFQSQWHKHQFSRVRFSVSDAVPGPSSEKAIQVGGWDLIGPFAVESEEFAYTRKFGSEGGDFKEDQTFRFRDNQYAWQTDLAYPDAAASTLPTVEDQVSAVLLHREIAAPNPQKIIVLLGTQDGYQLYVNKKKVGQREGERVLSPLEDEIEVALKKGKNDLLLKVVNYGRQPSRFAFALRAATAPIPKEILAIAKTDIQQRTASQAAALESFYRRVVSTDPDWLVLRSQKDGVLKQIADTKKNVPTTLVWKELTKPRPSHILTRGEYDQKGEQVPRAVPVAFPSLPEDAPNNRLGLAKWLTDPSHPLTSRVIVNRFWQQLFGTGIVKTSEDFGAQGQPPSHPRLLDWLAMDFRDHGWNVKRTIKQIMMSQTYRRSRHQTARQREIDPANRLLARGPRFRLDAEVLRDQALAVSGLLVEKVGGPSVKPPQPAGLWKAVGYTDSNTANFKPDQGANVYRRSLYTFWKRTSAPPTMTMFDAPSRESCTARRERTNTPLQALVMLNEIQFVEAARALARRALAEGGRTDSSRIGWTFHVLTARQPTTSETSELEQLLRDARGAFASQPDNAEQLSNVADSANDQNMDSTELAAWTVLASTMLNLDEVVTK